MNLPSRAQTGQGLHHQVYHSGGKDPLIGIPEQNMGGPSIPAGAPVASAPTAGGAK